MKNLQSILANLLLLAFIAACSKKESNYSENQTPNLDFENQKFQLKNINMQADSNGFLIDERPYYEL
jgi:hypothetical protein